MTPALDDFELPMGPILLPWGQFFFLAATNAHTSLYIVDPNDELPAPVVVNVPESVTGFSAPHNANASPRILVRSSGPARLIEVPSGVVVASLTAWTDYSLEISPDGDGVIASDDTSAAYIPLGSIEGVFLCTDATQASVRIPTRWPAQ